MYESLRVWDWGLLREKQEHDLMLSWLEGHKEGHTTLGDTWLSENNSKDIGIWRPVVSSEWKTAWGYLKEGLNEALLSGVKIWL